MGIGLLDECINELENAECYASSHQYSMILKNLYSRTSTTLEGSIPSTNVVSTSIETNEDVPMTDNVIDTRPVHLYFNRQLDALSNLPKEVIDVLGQSPKNIICCRSWSELPDFMKLYPKSICFQANELQYTSAVEIVNMIKTLAKLVGVDDNISISVCVEKTTTYEEIKEFQKSNINSIVPYYKDFGLEETMKGLTAQWHDIPYWPKHIIEQLPGSKKKETTKSGEIKLTTRQQQIYDLVSERGLSNKHIAKTLNITESTVKLHMGNILQKFGAKNRTQLVAFKKQAKSYKEV